MKKLGIILGIIFGIILLASLIAPKDFILEREIIIEKPLNATFMKILFLKNHEQWSYYFLKDSNIQKSYRGQDGTEGFTFIWSSQDEEIGSGEQEIIHIYNEQIIKSQIRLEKPFKTTFESYFKTEPQGEKQTKVIMGMHSKTPMPLNLISFVYNDLLGYRNKLAKNMDETLARMKSVLEEETPVKSVPVKTENHSAKPAHKK